MKLRLPKLIKRYWVVLFLTSVLDVCPILAQITSVSNRFENTISLTPPPFDSTRLQHDFTRGFNPWQTVEPLKKNNHRFAPRLALLGGYNIPTKEIQGLVQVGLLYQGSYSPKLTWEIAPAIETNNLGNYQSYNKKELSFLPFSISYSPNKHVHFQLGQQTHFWGQGYRSLMLSDIGGPMPFGKVVVSSKKLQYSYLASRMYTYSNELGSAYKYGVFHHLSWNLPAGFNVGFFESVIWQASTPTRSRAIDANYLNPMIFFRPIEYSLGSSDNVLLAVNASWKSKKGATLYGQFMMDEFLLKEVVAGLKHHLGIGDVANYGWWGNKQAAQLGVKFPRLGKNNNWYLLTEINAIRPYTYAHASPQQSYTHNQFSLAHPLGSNLFEGVLVAQYRTNKKHLFQLRAIVSEQGVSPYGIIGLNKINVGHDPTVSYMSRYGEYNQNMLQGERSTYGLGELSYHILIWPQANLYVSGLARIQFRNFNPADNYTYFVGAGVTSSLYRWFADF